jgi:hypothetical protein
MTDNTYKQAHNLSTTQNNPTTCTPQNNPHKILLENKNKPFVTNNYLAIEQSSERGLYFLRPEYEQPTANNFQS